MLGYKQQVLDSLRTEHAALLQQVAEQEKVIARLVRLHKDLNALFLQ